MSDKQLIDEVVGYLTKDGAVMDLSRARQGAELIRRQHSRIESDEALMRQARQELELMQSLYECDLKEVSSSEVVALRSAITALRKRLESSK